MPGSICGGPVLVTYCTLPGPLIGGQEPDCYPHKKQACHPLLRRRSSMYSSISPARRTSHVCRAFSRRSWAACARHRREKRLAAAAAALRGGPARPSYAVLAGAWPPRRRTGRGPGRRACRVRRVRRAPRAGKGPAGRRAACSPEKTPPGRAKMWPRTMQPRSKIMQGSE